MMKTKANIQTEVDAAFLYRILAENEKDAQIAAIFKSMSEIEMSHAQAFLEHGEAGNGTLPAPSFRAKALHQIGKIFGYDYVLGVLLDTEKSISNQITRARRETGTQPALTDQAHVRILKNIMQHSPQLTMEQYSRFERQHKSIGGNALRAAVLGGNDGLVSNFSLVMGVAGATTGQKEILLTGIAGLLAGALSMALGEWISVKSSQELYENQMELEKAELEHNPQGEEKELALIYASKGIPMEQAAEMARKTMADPEAAHQVLVREELGINPEDLKSSAMEAAVTSFLLFAVGAIIPVIPYFFTSGYSAILISASLSTIGLFLIGAAITLFTGKNVWYSGFRQVLFGLLAAAITFGIGKLIGVSIAG
jgi:VIT1/CCC1 family predicted Fe2+/Mn2+ transporter/rubrerythrin